MRVALPPTTPKAAVDATIAAQRAGFAISPVTAMLIRDTLGQPQFHQLSFLPEQGVVGQPTLGTQLP